MGASMSELLPPNATPVERAFDATAARLTAMPVPLRDLWNPAQCPAHLLPWLAWTVSVDEWESVWTEAQQRDVIAASVGVHRRKGTLASVRRALTAAGFPDAVVLEQWANFSFDGELTADGTETFEGAGHWAAYRVVMASPITIKQALAVRAILRTTAPARCRLDALDFAAAQFLFDGEILADGTYTFGEA